MVGISFVTFSAKRGGGIGSEFENDLIRIFSDIQIDLFPPKKFEAWTKKGEMPFVKGGGCAVEGISVYLLKLIHSSVVSSAHTGSNPKHTIYAFSACIIEIVMRKEQKRPGLPHYF